MNNNTLDHEEIKAVHIHLELKDEYLTEDQKRMLRRYGESTTGESISRDVLIPSDLPLHNLHYAIQKLFGWQNSHLRCFQLPEDVYQQLTGGTVKGWADLVGTLFQPPSEAEEDLFWDDDYVRGNFSTWLKKKYTGPYHYEGLLEVPTIAQNDVKRLLQRFQLKKMTLEEMDASILLEGGRDHLLERLTVNEILTGAQEPSPKDLLFPTAKEIIYTYDFGDGWTVTITRGDDCAELLKLDLVSQEEVDFAKALVQKEHRPVCIHKDGAFVIDDVGGLGGYADFLKTVYEDEDQEESQRMRAWAKSLGWSEKKISSLKIL